MPEIIGVFVTAGPLLVAKSRQREEEARQQRIAEQRRHEEQQRQQLERNRWRRFSELAEQWQQARLARAFLDALKSKDLDPSQIVAGKSTNDWLSWAEAQIRAADPLSYGATGIFGDVAAINAWTYRD